MKKITLVAVSFITILFSSCAYLTNQGVVIGPPSVKTQCVNPVSGSEVSSIKSKIESESFKSDKIRRARFVTKDKCFRSSQVVQIIDSFSFEDNKLDLAKDLYDQCTDPGNYDIVVDALVHKSNKDNLRDFIASQG